VILDHPFFMFFMAIIIEKTGNVSMMKFL